MLFRSDLADHLEVAREKYSPIDIINEHLLEGMKVVGELFGSGQMQLPFVLQSAEFLPRLLTPRRCFVITTLVLTLAVGLSAAIADNRLANSYRDLAGGMGAQYADNGTKVWELGEFGFRYYMEQAGFEYLGVDSVAEPGDLVVVSYISSKGVVAPLPEGAYTVVSRIETESAFPVRTMNPWAGAGFYGNLMGPIPIVPSTDKLDEITVNMLYWETE